MSQLLQLLQLLHNIPSFWYYLQEILIPLLPKHLVRTCSFINSYEFVADIDEAHQGEQLAVLAATNTTPRTIAVPILAEKDQQPTKPTQPQLYRSTGERFLARQIPELFNRTASYLKLKDFARFQEVFQSNTRCRVRWPKLRNVVHHAGPSLFGRFKSKAALRWVLEKGINARGWELRLKGPKGPNGKSTIVTHNDSFAQVCGTGDLDVVRAMVERSEVDINLADQFSRNPLHRATGGKGHFHVVQYLCEHGADIEAKDNTGWTPLHYAADKGCVNLVKYLCDQGADKETRSNACLTPLHNAANGNDLAVVQYICEIGADMEARNVDGWTPLHSAVWSERLPVVRYLCERGADQEARDSDNKTPRGLSEKRTDVRKYLDQCKEL